STDQCRRNPVQSGLSNSTRCISGSRLSCGEAGNAQILFSGGPASRVEGCDVFSTQSCRTAASPDSSAGKSTGCAILSHLGRRFHGVYHTDQCELPAVSKRVGGQHVRKI